MDIISRLKSRPLFSQPVFVYVCLIFTLGSFGSSLNAFERSEDVRDSKDYEGIVRYPSSKIDTYSVQQAADYQLALGGLKKINGLLQPEYSNRLNGRLTKLTYRIPDGHSATAAFQHFARQFKSGEVLFECQGRECGSSSHWASQIFKVAKLYGPEKHQHYQATRLGLEGKELVAVIYSIKRGNKRVYAHLDLLEVEGAKVPGLSVNPETIRDRLREDGSLNLGDLAFDADFKLSEASRKSLQPVAKALQKDVRLMLYVVGHLSGGEATEKLVETSLRRAVAVKEQLVEFGVSENRLESHGVGPLAPLGKASQQAGRIELVVRN